MADLITQADLENRIGVTELIHLTDDDDSGQADADKITWALSTASSYAKGLLYKGFQSEEKIELVVAADPALKNDVVEIAVGLLGGRRRQLVGEDGRNPYSGWREKAEQRLQQVAVAKRRAIGEETGGSNDTIGTTVQPDRAMIFAATKDDPIGPGGF